MIRLLLLVVLLATAPAQAEERRLTAKQIEVDTVVWVAPGSGTRFRRAC